MTPTPSEYARIFRAAAEGINHILPWKAQQSMQYGISASSYSRSDYAQQEGMAAAFESIAEMFEKMASDTPPESVGDV